MHQVRPLNVWPQERLFIAVAPSVKQPILLLFLLGHASSALNVWPQERLFIAGCHSDKQPILQKDAQNTPKMIHPYDLLALSERSEEVPFFPVFQSATHALFVDLVLLVVVLPGK